MMHAEQNYIYILFVILYLVYGFIKARKKTEKDKPVVNKDTNPQPVSTINKKEQKRVPSKQKDFTTVLEEVIGKFIPIPEDNHDKSVPGDLLKEDEKPEHPLIATSLKQAKEKVKFKINKKIVYRERESEESEHLGFQESENQNILSDTIVQQGVDDAFDIRNAIISSTIIQRPEW